MKNKLKNLLAVGLGIVLIATTIPQTAYAYTVPSTVRVGLESVSHNVTSTTIGGTELIVGRLGNTRFYEEGNLTSANGFTATVKTGTMIGIEDEFDQDEAESIANSLTRLGLDAYPSYLGSDGWTVYVENATLAQVENLSQLDAERISNFSGFLVVGSKSTALLSSEKDAYLMGTGTNDTITVKGSPYRGYLTFAVNGTVMTAVNVIGLEEYLYGVVPSEMPQSYELEALKAQAVAARTYAMTKLGAHTTSGYQLCDTTACQVYLGYKNEAARTTTAINETSGVVACYNGTPIEAVYSASTGGYTENSENVWNTVVPYLRAVPEFAEEGDNSWTATLTLSELNALLVAKNANIGTATDIVITKLSTGGRVQEMKIVGTTGSVTLTKETIRTYFSSTAMGSLPGKMFTINGEGGEIGVYGGSKNSNTTTSTTTRGSLASAASAGILVKTEGALSSLNGSVLTISGLGNTSTLSTSSDYEVYSVSLSTIENNKFVFEGVGRGHGAGLSQKGAQSMAKLGYTYEEILKHYYTGITLEK